MSTFAWRAAASIALGCGVRSGPKGETYCCYIVRNDNSDSVSISHDDNNDDITTNNESNQNTFH